MRLCVRAGVRPIAAATIDTNVDSGTVYMNVNSPPAG